MTAEPGAEVAAPGAEVAVPADEATPFESWEDPIEDWPHSWVEFMGDRLAVRKPTQQGITAYGLGTSKFMSAEDQLAVTGKLIRNHMTGDSYARVMDRMLDPDDPAYNFQTVGELMKMIFELRGAPKDSTPS